MSEPMYQVPLDRVANQPVPEGIHPFSVSEIEEGESSSQNPMWTVTLACLTPGEEGKTVPLFLVLTPSARWKLEQFFDAVGAPTSGMVTADRFKGRKLRCQITHEDYQGRKQARVGEMWAMTASPVAKAPAAPQVAVSKTSKKPTTARQAAGEPQPVAHVKQPVSTGLPADQAGEDAIPF